MLLCARSSLKAFLGVDHHHYYYCQCQEMACSLLKEEITRKTLESLLLLYFFAFLGRHDVTE
jgi:hypothetical protein